MINNTLCGNKISGFYRGKVLKHCDNGKCKIMIYGVYPETWKDSPEKLPDAEQASSIGFDNTPGNGFFSYPEIGSIVWCFFANEDQNLPVYFATCQGGPQSNSKFNEIYKPDEDGKKTFITENKIIFGNINISFNKGNLNEKNITPSLKISTQYTSTNNLENTSYIEILNNGSIKIHSCKDLEFESFGDIKMHANNYIEIKTNKQLNLTANNYIIIRSINAGIKMFSKYFTAIKTILSKASKII